MNYVQRHTAFALAFVNAVRDGKSETERSIIKAAEKHNAGIVKEPAVNAHLKHKTYKSLVANGQMYR